MHDPMLNQWIGLKDRVSQSLPVAFLAGGQIIVGWPTNAGQFAEEAEVASKVATQAGHAAMLNAGRSQEDADARAKQIIDSADLSATAGQEDVDHDTLTLRDAMIHVGGKRQEVGHLRVNLSSVDAWWIPEKSSD